MKTIFVRLLEHHWMQLVNSWHFKVEVNFLVLVVWDTRSWHQNKNRKHFQTLFLDMRSYFEKSVFKISKVEDNNKSNAIQSTYYVQNAVLLCSCLFIFINKLNLILEVVCSVQVMSFLTELLHNSLCDLQSCISTVKYCQFPILLTEALSGSHCDMKSFQVSAFFYCFSSWMIVQGFKE